MKRGGPLKRRKRLAYASRKELEVSRPAKAVAVAVLVERSNGACEMGRFSSRCTGVGVVPHHMLKQAHTSEHDPALMRWSCWWCNAEVEERPAEAHAAGLTIKSWERPGSHVRLLTEIEQ